MSVGWSFLLTSCLPLGLVLIDAGLCPHSAHLSPFFIPPSLCFLKKKKNLSSVSSTGRFNQSPYRFSEILWCNTPPCSPAVSWGSRHVRTLLPWTWATVCSVKSNYRTTLLAEAATTHRNDRYLTTLAETGLSGSCGGAANWHWNWETPGRVSASFRDTIN